VSEAQKKPVILAVDDDSDLLALMGKVLGADYQFVEASDAGTAIEKAFADPRPDLILLDIEMPDVNGFEVCQALKAEAQTADIPVIFLTGKSEPQAQVEGFELGAVDYVTKPINAGVLKARVRLHLALVDRRLELEHLVSDRTAQLSQTRAELIKRLSRALELHESAAVGNRVMRLSQYAALLSQAAGAKPKVCEMMETAAPLHDIGKLGVPTEILRKKEKLSVPDWERVKRHPEIGAEIIGEHDDPLLKLARQLALTHHEHWDGTGYPKGLKGDEIPWPGRVMAVADAFEAMTTTQFHREPLSLDDACFEIEKGAKRKYDPKIVEAFKKALPDMKRVLEQYSDQLGDMINLDFAPAGKSAAPAPAKPAAPAPAKPAPAPVPTWTPKPKPKLSAAELAKAAAKRK